MVVIVFLCGAVSLFALVLREEVYVLDLIANFAHCSAAGLLLFAAILLALRRRRQAAQLMLLIIAHGFYLRSYLDRVEPSIGERRLKLLSYNMFEINSRKREAIDFVLETGADVVLLLEGNRGRWDRELARLDVPFPHRIRFDREDLPDRALGNFGIALYSKYPLEGAVITDPGSGVPFVSALVRLNDVSVRVLGVHTFAPLSEHYWRANRLLVDRVLAEIRPGESAVVAGDLNSTPTGSAFERIRRSGLLPAGMGRLLRQTLRIKGIRLLQVDHIFVTRGVRIIDDGIGPSTGSDHNPIFTTISLN